MSKSHSCIVTLLRQHVNLCQGIVKSICFLILSYLALNSYPQTFHDFIHGYVQQVVGHILFKLQYLWLLQMTTLFQWFSNPYESPTCGNFFPHVQAVFGIDDRYFWSSWEQLTEIHHTLLLLPSKVIFQIRTL